MTCHLPPKVDLTHKKLGLFELFRTGHANIVSTIPAQLLSQTILSGRMLWKWHSISGPDEMRRVLVENEANYPKAPVVRRILRPAIKESMFLVEGGDHQWQRRASAPYFTLRESLKYIPTFLSHAATQADSLPENPSFQLEALEYMVDLTLSIIVSVTCSTDDKVNTEQIRDAFTDYLDTTARLSPMAWTRICTRLCQRFPRLWTRPYAYIRHCHYFSEPRLVRILLAVALWLGAILCSFPCTRFIAIGVYGKNPMSSALAGLRRASVI